MLVADRDPEAAADLIERLSGVGDGASFVETDASDPDQIRAMIDRAAELGQLRLLVNNAGGWLPGPQFPDTDAWGRSLDLNLRMYRIESRQFLIRENLQHKVEDRDDTAGRWPRRPG